ncbi:AraC family transcriptional regulator, partial [Mesorhizobium sp. M4A.F.Ca.ET.029.04.2.1]
VISFAEPFAIGLGRDPGDNDRFASFAAGLFAGPVVIQSFGGACCVQINFTPLGARRFFGLPMSELTDRMVGLDDVLGLEGIALRERLGEARDWSSRFAIAESFVAARLAEAKRMSAEIAWAYRQVIGSGGRTRVSV